MPAPHERPGDPSFEGQAPETSTRRLREQSQLDFELEFIGKILERDPFHADALSPVSHEEIVAVAMEAEAKLRVIVRGVLERLA